MSGTRCFSQFVRCTYLGVCLAFVYCIIAIVCNGKLVAQDPAENGRNTTMKTEVNSTIRQRMPGTSPAVSGDTDYYVEGWAVFAENQTVKYRVPLAMTTKNSTYLIAAVLSTAHKPLDRDLIRKSWGNKNRTAEADVYYAVAGPYKAIQEEFEQEQDVIWVDAPEVYDGLLVKVKTMLTAIHTMTNASYNYIMKNDDDQYSRLWQTVEMLKSKDMLLQNKSSLSAQTTLFSRNAYQGSCRHHAKPNGKKDSRWHVDVDKLPPDLKEWPAYAGGGAGYVMKRDLISVLVQRFEKEKSLVDNIEDISIGQHALNAGARCWKSMCFSSRWQGRHGQDFADRGICALGSFHPGEIRHWTNGVLDFHWWDCCILGTSSNLTDPTCGYVDCTMRPPNIPDIIMEKRSKAKRSGSSWNGIFSGNKRTSSNAPRI